MIILGVITALMLIALAYLKGEKDGEAMGYERGTFDGRQGARNAAAISAAEVARRQRETAERARQTAPEPKVIDDIPAVPAAAPVISRAQVRVGMDGTASAAYRKRKSRHR